MIVVAAADATSRVQACLHRGADDYLLLPHDETNPLLVRKRIASALRVYAAGVPVAKLCHGRNRRAADPAIR